MTWEPGSNGSLPADAFYGGDDHGPVYVGRVQHEGNTIPGKVMPTHHTCFFGWNGRELRKGMYEVLRGTGYTWVPYKANKPLPPKVCPGGRSRTGEKIYIARANHQGVDVVGQFQPSLGKCYVPYCGVDHPYVNFDILCFK